MKNQKNENKKMSEFIMFLFIIILLCSGSFMILEGIRDYLNGDFLFGWFCLTFGSVALFNIVICVGRLAHREYNL